MELKETTMFRPYLGPKKIFFVFRKSSVYCSIINHEQKKTVNYELRTKGNRNKKQDK